MKDRGLPYIRLDGGALAFDLELVREWALAQSVPALDACGRLQHGCTTGLNGRDLTGKQKVVPIRGRDAA